MWYRPPEIDFDFDKLTLAYGENLCITKEISIRGVTFIRDKYSVAVRNEIDEVEALDHLTVWPTILEVGFAIDPVVERTGEMKILRDQLLDRQPRYAAGTCSGV